MQEAVVFAQLQPFIARELTKVINQVCDENPQEETNVLANKLADSLVNHATGISENFKYIVNVSLSQGPPAALATQGTAHWDPETDGSVVLVVNRTQGRLLVTVFCVAL